MPDRDLPPEEVALARARLVVESELERAGLQLEDWRVNSLAADLVAGENSEDAQQFMALLQLGQGRGGPANQGTPPEAVLRYPQIFGHNPSDLWMAQREGWDGYGWTTEKRQALGRNEQPRELSHGGRWANTWYANRNFADALLKQGDAIKVEELNRDMLQDPAQARMRVLKRILDEHQRVRSQTHGESGFVGAMTNPEYTAGAALQAMTPFSEGASLQALDVSDPRENPYYIPDYLKSSWLADPAGNLLHQAVQYGGHYYPKAKIEGEVYALRNAVEPPLPAGTTPEKGSRQLFEAAERRNPTLDELYRMQTGRYPSYAGSMFARMLNGLIDPSIAAVGPAAKATHLIGKGMSGAGHLIGKGTLGGDFFRRWGSNLMRDASWSNSKPWAAAAIREGMDEGPTNLGIEGLVAAGSPQTPRADDWGVDTNEARTDLYQRDPKTGQMRPETNDEFRKRMARLQGQLGNSMVNNQALLDAVQRGRLPEPANPQPDLMQRLGGMGAGGH
jgi:hypothetical protein